MLFGVNGLVLVFANVCVRDKVGGSPVRVKLYVEAPSFKAMAEAPSVLNVGGFRSTRVSPNPWLVGVGPT